MAKLFYKMLKNLSVKNAPSGGTSRSAGTGGSFNRDPKAIQVKRIGFQLTNGSGGGRDNFEGPDVDFDLINTAIKRDSYLTQAVMKYEELIFKSGWSFQSKNAQALQYLKLRFDVMAIATGIPTEELFNGIVSDIVRYSNCFLVKARTKKGQGLPPGVSITPVPPSKDPIGGYFRLPPQTMQIARDQNGNITKYQQQASGGGDTKEFKPEDIVHLRVNVPSGKVFGDPWLAPVLEDVRLLRKVEENAALLLYRHIFPLFKYQVGIDKPGYEATDEEINELRAIIEDMPTDGAIVLPERHNVEAVNFSAIDGRPYLDYFENRVFSGLGLSAVDFGRGDTANRNTADAMTGVKADRVKGWQQAIQMQIDKFIIEELLVEGGFDPIVNPDFDVNFVFNEIELERKIAKETHEIFKFNNNIQTWDETRVNIGLEPVADESRLHYQMIGQTGQQPSKEADNKNQPENQNGKRSGPKSPTEKIHDRYFYEKFTPISYSSLQERKKNTPIIQETVMNRIPIEPFEALTLELESMYSSMKSDVLESLQHQLEKQSYPIQDPKTILGSLHFEKNRMLRIIEKKSHQLFADGISAAKEDLGKQRNPKINYELAQRVLKDYANDFLESLNQRLQKVISEELSEMETGQEALLIVSSVFDSLKFKMKAISNSVLVKSFNYGYVLTLLHHGEKYAQAYDEGGCTSCQQKNQKLILLQSFSSFDELSIFYQIPPWHPNCKCELRTFKGEEL